MSRGAMARPRSVGVITARGGSKGLPGKNIRPLGGRPLLAWTVDAACSSGVIDALVLSTDSDEIAAVAKELGVDVPFLRPDDLATDAAGSAAVVLHALDWLRENRGWLPDWVWLLQPTSPLRTAEHLRTAWRIGSMPDVDSVLGVVRPKHHPSWCMTEGEDGALRPLFATDSALRRQDLFDVWAPNGAVYLTRVVSFRQELRFSAGRCLPLPMEPWESLDIDTPHDWAVAEALLPLRVKG